MKEEQKVSEKELEAIVQSLHDLKIDVLSNAAKVKRHNPDEKISPDAAVSLILFTARKKWEGVPIYERFLRRIKKDYHFII